MNVTMEQHITIADLARLAFRAKIEPGALEFARSHLRSGCGICELQLGALSRGPRGTAVEPWRGTEWIVPDPVRRETMTRAGAVAEHQFMCTVGSFELDVLVRPVASGRQVEIGGRLAQADGCDAPVGKVPVALIDAWDLGVVATVRTDEFGEFDFVVPRGGCYGLRIGEWAGAPCVLVWGDAD